MAAIVCKEITKRYGNHQVVHKFDLSVRENEFVVFLGPSGCGKSTILRMLAGLEEISDGELSIAGKVVNDLPPRDRDIAMVFQNYALYPHMSVFGNIAFGLKRLKVSKSEIDRRVREVASMLGLEPYLERKPAALSGGQQQRVAIARAMIKTPAVFLFDEPLSNLDAKLRNHMRVEIARLHQALKTTTVYVTHDQLEAMTLADRIVLLKEGRIEQLGTPKDIYENPRTKFVASFIGTPSMNFIDMVVSPDGANFVLTSDETRLVVEKERYNLQSGQMVAVGIRPAHLEPASESSRSNIIAGTVDLIEYLGNEALVNFALGSVEISALLDANACPQLKQSCRLTIDEKHIHIFDRESELSLIRKLS